VRIYRYPRTGPKVALAGQGAIRTLAEAYTKSPEFKVLSTRWQAARHHYIGILEDELGWLSLTHIQLRKARDDFYAVRDQFADKPFMADKLIDTLRTLLAWGYERGKIDVNQGIGIKRLSATGKTRSDKIWTEDHEAIVYASFPPYLVQAFQFALYSAARQSDMCSLRWSQYPRRLADFPALQDAVKDGRDRLPPGVRATALRGPYQQSVPVDRVHPDYGDRATTRRHEPPGTLAPGYGQDRSGRRGPTLA